MEETKRKVEAILFAGSKRITAEEIHKYLPEASLKDIEKSLAELKKEYEASPSAITLVNDENTWKLSLKTAYMPMAEKLMPSTELARGVVETLALIAWKSPILQSDIVHLRSPVVYDHIHELEQMGLVTRAPKGRSFVIKLTEKFHDYFDLPKEKAKEIFEGYQEPQPVPPAPPLSKEQEKENYEKLLKEIHENKINPEELIKKDTEFLKEFDNRLSDIGQRTSVAKNELQKLDVDQQAQEVISTPNEENNENNEQKKEEDNEGSN